MKRRLWLLRTLLIAGVLLSIPNSLSPPNSGTTPDEIYASMRELIRIPLSDVKPGSVMRFNARIQPSKLGEHSIGHRFFQASLIQQGATHWMLPWPKEGVSIEATQDGKTLPLREVRGEFYMVSNLIQGTTGLAFDPAAGKDCTLAITFKTSYFPKDAELVVAPNWPNPMFIKDQIVGAMLTPTFDLIALWMNRIVLAMIIFALLLTFRVPRESVI